MRTIFQLINMLFILILNLHVNAQTNPSDINDPIAYNDFIVNQQGLINVELNALFEVMQDINKTKESIMQQHAKVVSTAKTAIASLKQLKKLDPDFDFQVSAINLFDFYIRTLETGYILLIDELLKEKPDETLIENELMKLSEEEVIYDGAFAKAQESFAAHYNFTLE